MKLFLRGMILLACTVAASQARDEAQTRNLTVAVGKSIVIDSPIEISRVSVANPDVLEAVGISPKEVLINGKSGGTTSLILWRQGGSRVLYDVSVLRPVNTLLQTVREELARELKGQDVSVTVDKDFVFLHGTVNDLSSSSRAVAIAGTLGKTVNLLRVSVPPERQQILLKVRFADVDRSISSQLGMNLFSTGAANTIGGATTQQFSPPALSVQNSGRAASTQISLSDALNLFLYRPDLNLGATIAALQAHNVLQILAEPNLLTLDGKEASFLAGGEFPYPTVQGGSTNGNLAITIQFKEFGIKLKFTPIITPRGTIRLTVAPEVSALDFANGLVYQGFSIPALSTRRVQTEIELESGQSFAIAGLLDNRVSEILSKVPGLGDVPILGKLFQSRSQTKSNSELVIIVTPELVRPIPAGLPRPQVDMPREFLPEGAKAAPRTPGENVTGPVPVKPLFETLPVEDLLEEQQREQGISAPIPAPSQTAPAAPPVSSQGPAGVPGQPVPAIPNDETR